MSNLAERAQEIVWIPAVPLPWLGVTNERCGQCGKRFWFGGKRAKYERHYRQRHDRAHPECQMAVSVAEAKRIYAEAGIGFGVKAP